MFHFDPLDAVFSINYTKYTGVLVADNDELNNQRKKVKKTSAYRKWYGKLKDERLRAIIRGRISRAKRGLLGDIRPERGVSEFTIDFGPGCRIYFIQNAKVIVLLLGGDKSSQDEDIVTAKNMVKDIKGRLKR
ncbi:hypothetical protein AGMMS49942_25550 [Spirochaetia bacterium]|nr:hypothetical protein AGMMS49942_25550 [Spirochaetia bacterium]